MISAAEVQSMLRDFGETITLRRVGSPNTDVSVLAKIDGAGEQIGAAGVAQFRRRVILSNIEIAAAGWPGPPHRGDQVILSGPKTLTVQTVDTVSIGTDTIMHALETLGS